jgi:hypothetical protein
MTDGTPAAMPSTSRWRKIQQACEWPIAGLALGSAVVLLTYRMGALPGFAPSAILIAVSLGLIAVIATLIFVGLGIVLLWRAHAGQGDVRQRAISVLKAGLRLKPVHSVCRACVGRGFTWTLAPGDGPLKSGVQILRTWEDAPTRLKVECPSCGGSGFTGA